jgi:hypothetical protein
LYTLIIGFRTNSLLVETRVKSTLYTPILYWSGARHWVAAGEVILPRLAGQIPSRSFVAKQKIYF